MSVDDSLDDGQPQTRAAGTAVSRPVHDVKTLEDMRKVSIRNPVPGVAHAQYRIAIARIDLDANAPPLRSMTQRVIDEIDKDLRQPVGIRFDANRAQRRKLERDAFIRCLLLEGGHDWASDFFQVDVAQGELKLPGLRTCLFE